MAYQYREAGKELAKGQQVITQDGLPPMAWLSLSLRFRG